MAGQPVARDQAGYRHSLVEKGALPMPRMIATLASAFLASLGIGAPIHYTDGQYVRIATVLADLDYLGIHQIRTGPWFHGMQGEQAYHTAARAGVRFDMVLNTTDTMGQSVAQMAQFAAAHPGALAAIEGPNEINNFGAHYRGMTDAAAAVMFQDDLYRAIAANPVLRGTTVFSYTMNAGASSTTGYDYAAIHPYAVAGRPPRAFLDTNIASVPAGKPFVLTETGYPTLASDKDGVDAHTQAVYNLDMVFDAARAGAAAIYLYELLDAYPDPDGTHAGSHFGLFDHTNAPKPAAVALHNLHRILDGGGAFAPGSPDPGSLDITADPAVRTLLLHKAPGVFDLVVWDEQPLWNRQSHTRIVPQTHRRAIRFGPVPATLAVFDPMRSTTPLAMKHDTARLDLDLGEDPLIIEVKLF
jgi:hypothetical protein